MPRTRSLKDTVKDPLATGKTANAAKKTSPGTRSLKDTVKDPLVVKKPASAAKKTSPRTRSLKDTVKDPLVVKKPANATKMKTSRKQPAGKGSMFKIVLSLLIGFAGGLVTGRFIRIL